MDEKAPPENVQGQVIAVCLSEYKGERKKTSARDSFWPATDLKATPTQAPGTAR